MTARDERSAGRANVFLAATLQTEGKSLPVRIRNISAVGALIEGANLPLVDESVRLQRAHLSAAATVAWRANDLAGIRFEHRIDVNQWVRPPSGSGYRGATATVTSTHNQSRGEPPLVDGRPLHDVSRALDETCERLGQVEDLPPDATDQLKRLNAIARLLREIIVKDR